MTNPSSTSRFAPLGPFMGRIPQGRPSMPVEMLDMSEDEYEEMLEKSGYSERFIERELEEFKQYKQRVLTTEKEKQAVEEGPHLTDQQKALNRRQKRLRGD